jgi:acetyltransferase-like isoleucine patch superfamily enzyme
MSRNRTLISLSIQLLLLLMPWPLRRLLLWRLLGFEIGANARIGASVIIAGEVSLEAASRVGHLTVVKGLKRLELAEYAAIGNRNWISGFPDRQDGAFAGEIGRRPELIVERHAAITNSHIIDCTNQVRIGCFATVAGWRSQILTHGIDIGSNKQRSAPVSIGRYSFVGTGCILVKGSALPDFAVLGAGSVLTKRQNETHVLYSGVPAVKVRVLNEKSLYFNRLEGLVD